MLQKRPLTCGNAPQTALTMRTIKFFCMISSYFQIEYLPEEQNTQLYHIRKEW